MVPHGGRRFSDEHEEGGAAWLNAKDALVKRRCFAGLKREGVKAEARSTSLGCASKTYPLKVSQAVFSDGKLEGPITS
jgi:hypothetical protein